MTTIGNLPAAFQGAVLLPGDPAYDGARRTFNGMFDRRPACIVRPAATADVAAAVRWAAGQGLPIGIRGGGHSVVGHSMPDDAVVIDLSWWRTAEVDVDTGTVEALGGCLLMDLDAATSSAGGAVPSGTFVDTGVAGLTLSGGIGYLLGVAGYGCDALVGAELVTADGEVVQVDDRREADLLWALRGGGGNFGVVTRFRFRMTPVGRMYAGSLRYRGDGVRDVLGRLVELDAGAPDGLATQAVLWRSEETDGAGLTVIAAWLGDEVTGRTLLAPLRESPALYDDDVRPMSWLELQSRNAPIPFGWRHYWKSHFIRETPAALLDACVEAASGATGDDFVLLELVHGAAHRIAAESAAFGGRAAHANASAIAMWTDPAHDEAHIAWSRRTVDALEPWSLAGGGYLNYAEADLTAARVAAAFRPGDFAKLQRVKRAVDPSNAFRFNGNIPPA